MSRNLYKTASGKLLVDMDSLRLTNETAVAVGNMGVNARGDKIAPDGSILETRNEIMKKRYNANTTMVQGFGSLTPAAPTADVTEAPADVVVQDTAPVTETVADAPKLRGALAASLAAPTKAPESLTSLEQPEQKLKRI